MLLSALINLIVNAIQIKGQEVEISINVERKGNNLIILVDDNGPGFSEEAKKYAFQPFFTTRNEGTGLGLAVVEAIISAHKGDVTLDSNPGEGSRFILQLPILEQENIVSDMDTNELKSGACA